ncbi:hypothetical protein EXS57_02540 [Candidatus Kaiserbacteria bacterium]|nr:hypothetical protein [Candidatus Kaiserbacteria bacterium]
MQKYLTIVAGIFVAALLFVPIMEFVDGNDYNILSTDPTTGLYRYVQNSSFRTAGDCYENTVVVNNLGFHGPPVSLEKPKDTFRIIMLGSSYVSEIQVPVEDMAATILQEKLNKNPNRPYTYEVIPIAIGGQSKMLLDIFYYLKYGSVLKPDLVINIESSNELHDEKIIDTSILDAQGNIVAETPKGNESKMVAFARKVSRNSKFLVNLYNRFLVFKSNLDPFFSVPFTSTVPSAPVSDAVLEENAAQAEQVLWQNKEKMLDIFATHVAKDDARFLYASWSGSWVATSTAAEFPQYGQKIAERNNFFYVDLVPVFQSGEVTSGRQGTYTCDTHWNIDGNRYIADAFFLYLTSHPALLSRKSL